MRKPWVHTQLMAKSRPERFLMALRTHESARRRGQASFPPHISAPERRRLLRQRFGGAPPIARKLTPPPNKSHQPYVTYSGAP